MYLRAPFDSDGDCVRDRVAVDIIRPAEAAAAGVKVPVIMDASPYFRCCGRGNESETKTYESDGTIGKLPLFYDNYFVPRGYAVAGVDLVGTARSTDCGDVGARYEVRGAKAAIDWLNGRLPGYDLQGKRVTADWTNGKVGMIGKSWDGTIANGVAGTGVDGLETVVPISAISSWYDSIRFGAVLRSSGYVHFLAGRRPEPAVVAGALTGARQTARSARRERARGMAHPALLGEQAGLSRILDSAAGVHLEPPDTAVVSARERPGRQPVRVPDPGQLPGQQGGCVHVRERRRPRRRDGSCDEPPQRVVRSSQACLRCAIWLPTR